MVTEQDGRRMTFYNHIESVRSIAIDLTNGRKWSGARDKATVFDALDAARREYMRLSDENTKLREMARSVLVLRHETAYKWLDATMAEIYGKSFTEQAQELGLEVD